MTWDELLEHVEKSCLSQDLQHSAYMDNLVAWGRAQVQNRMVGICKTTCKRESLEYMDNFSV